MLENIVYNAPRNRASCDQLNSHWGMLAILLHQIMVTVHQITGLSLAEMTVLGYKHHV